MDACQVLWTDEAKKYPPKRGGAGSGLAEGQSQERGEGAYIIKKA